MLGRKTEAKLRGAGEEICFESNYSKDTRKDTTWFQPGLAEVRMKRETMKENECIYWSESKVRVVNIKRSNILYRM